MSQKRSPQRKPEIRVYLEADLERLVRTIAAMKDSSLSAIVSEALEAWLTLPEQQKLIQRHSLDELDADAE